MSDKETQVFESLLAPFTNGWADRNRPVGSACRVLFHLIAYAPRLRDVWHARPNESWLHWHAFLGSFFREFDRLIDEQEKTHPSHSLRASSNELRPQLQPGFLELRYIDLREATPFGSLECRRPVRTNLMRNFLKLPSLELLRCAHCFHHPKEEDLQYTFEWESRSGTLRESIMTFIDEEEGFGPLFRWKYWPMRVLSADFGNRIINYECSNGTLQDAEALLTCARLTLESFTFTNETPEDLGRLLGRFSDLKTLTIGIDYLTRHEGLASSHLSILPASLQHLMIHSESHAEKRPLENQEELLQWTETVCELGSQLVATLYWMLVSDQLPNLRSMCLVQIWGNGTPDVLDAFVDLTTERGINLHLWSGSPDPDAPTCAHLCGRFVPTEHDQIRWPHGPRSWNFHSTYNWCTGGDETLHSKPWPYRLPHLGDESEMPTQFLQEWNEDFFKAQLRELFPNTCRPDGSDALADLDFMKRGLDVLDDEEVDMLVDKLCERYGVNEDKARRVEESVELGRKVVEKLGGEGGRLVCRDFEWQRVYD